MRNLNLTMPTHITEALRSNMSGGKSVAQPARGRRCRCAVHVAGRASRRASKPQSRISSCWMCANATPTKADTSQRRGCCHAASLSCVSSMTCPTRRSASLRTSELAVFRRWLRRRCANWATACRGLGRGMKAWREAGYPLNSDRSHDRERRADSSPLNSKQSFLPRSVASTKRVIVNFGLVRR